ncbi:hypothetical protein SAMN05444673_0083 [Bacillus sp. OV166]|nr:hypothetical protein SAMN05444673_0083 [Bacillus sp. OV166]
MSFFLPHDKLMVKAHIKGGAFLLIKVLINRGWIGQQGIGKYTILNTCLRYWCVCIHFRIHVYGLCIFVYNLYTLCLRKCLHVYKTVYTLELHDVYKFVIVVYNNVYILLKFTCCLHFYSYIFFTYKSLKNLSIFYTLKGVTRIT